MDLEDMDVFIATSLEKCKGEWTWSEEQKDLVFESNFPTTSKSIKSRKRSIAMPRHLLTIKPTVKPKSDSVITLDDVKSVAVNLIIEKTLISMNQKSALLFDQWYRLEAMDYMLWGVLLYYDQIHQKGRVKEKKDNTFLGLKKSGKKNQDDNTEKRVGQALADVGQAYSYFLLQDLSRNHQSDCDMSQSSGHEVNSMAYEALYEFVMRVVWICFGYENWDLIHREIGKIFKTESYNRGITAVEETGVEASEKVEDCDIGIDSDKSPPSLLVAHNARPAISSLNSTKSPAMRAISPTPQDKGQHFISRKTKIKPTEIFSPMTISIPTTSLGIIGDKHYKYETRTLKLLQAEKKKQEKLEKKKNKEHKDEEDRENGSDGEDSLTSGTQSEQDPTNATDT